jgi:hypothetical protein
MKRSRILKVEEVGWEIWFEDGFYKEKPVLYFCKKPTTSRHTDLTVVKRVEEMNDIERKVSKNLLQELKENYKNEHSLGVDDAGCVVKEEQPKPKKKGKVNVINVFRNIARRFRSIKFANPFKRRKHK